MLSPLLKPGGLNGGIGVTKLLTDSIGNLKDGLDKRVGGLGGITNDVRSVLNAGKAVTESITNALGVRSPYFVIGEIPANKSLQSQSLYNFSALGGVVRAVQALENTEQGGVIIDCLGDVTGNISVEFTKNPVLYASSTVLDSRIRKPTVVKATVAVSNYLSDNLIGAGVSTMASLDPTGIGTTIANELMYDGNTRAQQALYQLRNLLENGKPFTVYTPHGYYENMLIRSLEPKTTATSMDMLLCDIVFEEVIMYRPYFTDLRADAMPKRTNISSAPTVGISDNVKSFLNKCKKLGERGTYIS